MKYNLNKLAKDQWDWVESVGWHNKTALETLALVAEELGKLSTSVEGKSPPSYWELNLRT